MRHAVIMAGGAGVRLWPLSRKNRPKQLLRLFSGTSLLRQSFERVAALLQPANICVITSQNHIPHVAKELPELPAANLFGEPDVRDTANAVGLACAIIRHRDPEAVIGIFTADHMITPMEKFCSAVEEAYRTAEEDPEALVTFGIRPNRPDTQYGYIRRGQRVRDSVFVVDKFTEKPKLASAIQYVSSGEYYWNSGMFTWRADAVLNQLKKHLPQSYTPLMEIAEAWGTEQRQTKLESIYPTLMRISIDFAVMERADRALVVEMDCNWVDVGSWPSMESVIVADGEGNVSACSDVVHLGSRGNIVVSEERHLIATIGVDDLVVVHSPDATLICTKRDAAGLKELVDNIKRKYGEQFL